MTMPISRRRLLGLIAGTIGGAAFGLRLPVQAQGGEVATPEEAFLSPAEIEAVRARGLRIGFNIGHRHDDYSNAVIRAVQAVAVEYGLQLAMRESGFSTLQQPIDLEALLTEGVNGLFFAPLDVTLTGPLVEKANDANIPVVTLGGTPRTGSLLAEIDSQDADSAYAACRSLIAAVGGEGEIAILSVPVASNALYNQEQGAIRAISESKMQLIGVKPVKRFTEAFGVARNLLKNFPNLRAIFTLWNVAADSATEAISELGGEVKLGGFNIGAADFQRFAAKDARLVAFTGQLAAIQARAGIGLLCKHLLGQAVKPRLSVPTVLITADNYRDQWESVFPGLPAPWPNATPTPAN